MRIGIVHLSDIHFRCTDNDTDADSTLAKQICTAICADLIGTTQIVVLVSGDIAYSGQYEEYRRASDWFAELYTLIDDTCSASCAFFYCPGNHDVNHKDNRKTRTAVIDQIRTHTSLATDVELIQECTREQQDFLQFRDELEDPSSLVFNDLLLRIHRIHHGSRTVQINLLNTAWMSELQERQGSLIYPIDQYVDQLKTSNGFTIAVMHHPLNWFESENARTLRDELMRNSSIVCFGHEHMPDTKRGITSHGDHVLYVDGGMLNADDEQAASSFNLVLLDLGLEKTRYVKYERIDDRFVPENENDMEWQDASKLLSSASSRFRLKCRARMDLGDIGLNILHPRGNDLRLRDLFVYPDMLPMSQREAPAYEKLERTITSEHIIYKKDNRHIILEGEEKTGKTALLRMLFLEFYNQGRIPILILGNKINCNSFETIRNSLRNVFEETYDGVDFLQFEHLEASDRIVLVDDLGLNERGSDKAERLLQFLLDYCKCAVVTTRTFVAVEELLGDRGSSVLFQKYEIYSIQEFGHQKRSELIGKWLHLGQYGHGPSSPAILEDRDSARKTIDTVIGRNFVPSTPIFVLVILQSISSASANTIGSTYGDYYQFLITRSLMHAGVRPEDLDAYSNYVTELAYELYGNERELTQEMYFSWHLKFCENYAIEWRHDRIKSILEAAEILQETSTGHIQFRFPYIYYFFLARYISRRLSEPNMQDKVRFMCQRLHVSEYANVILFIIHHSDGSFVLDSLKDATASLLHGMASFRFDKDSDNVLLSWINGLPSEMGKPKLEDRDPEVEQKRELRQKDVSDAARKDLEKRKSREQELDHRPMKELSLLAQGSVSAKAVDLLGQVLKNYYGSLMADTKLAIAEEGVEVGFRALNLFLDLCLYGEEKIIRMLVEIRRDYEARKVSEKLRHSDVELVQWARNTLFSVIRSIGRAVILRVSRSLSARQLRPTLTRLAEENGTVAYGFVELAALLDGPRDIPRTQIERMVSKLKNNILGMQILRDMVARRVYRYPTDYTDKQWLADKLGFSITKQRYTDIDQSRRLLP